MFQKPKYIPQPDVSAAESPAWLAPLRAAAVKRLAEEGLPATTVEGWQFTAVKSLWQPANDSTRVHQGDIQSLLNQAEPLPEGPRLVLVNGRFNTGLSSLPENVQFVPLSKWEGALGEDRVSGFDDMTLALAEDGFVLTVKAGTKLELPLVVVHVLAGGDGANTTATRNVIALEKDASATLLEVVISGSAGVCAAHSLDVQVGEGAQLETGLVIHPSAIAAQVFTRHAHVAARGNLKEMVLNFGGKMARVETHLALEGEKAHAELNSLILLDDKRHAETVNRLTHAAVDATSNQLCRIVAGDQAHGIFQGCTVVEPGAHGTDAHQQNRNLLLSKTARIDAKPELQIDADDVACSHGSATGSLDKMALFYLQSRGIPETQARQILIGSFIEELVTEGTPEALRETMEGLVAVWLK